MSAVFHEVFVGKTKGRSLLRTVSNAGDKGRDQPLGELLQHLAHAPIVRGDDGDEIEFGEHEDELATGAPAESWMEWDRITTGDEIWDACP